MDVNTKISQFVELPKDILKKLILEYFNPLDALTCLRVCKDLKVLLSEKEMRRLRMRIVKEVAYRKQITWLDGSLKQCEMCGEELKKGRMPRHLARHQETIRKGGVVRRIKPAWEILEHCKNCGAPFPDYGPHKERGCPLDIIFYSRPDFVRANSWAEQVSSESRGYRIMEKYNNKFKCKSCNESFSPIDSRGQNGFHQHLMTCKFGMEITNLWRITIPVLKGRI